jgi:hypothetical protein
MFGLFKAMFGEAAKRTILDGQARDHLLAFGVDTAKVSDFKLANISAKSSDEIALIKNPTTVEKLAIYLINLHDEQCLNLYENELVLSAVIGLLKIDESRVAYDGYKAPLRYDMRSKVDQWCRSRVLR